MQRKRIAVITARADAYEQRELLYGIADAAFRADADVAVYSNVYNPWQEAEISTCENEIYALFDPSHYDGAIITAEAFNGMEILGDVIRKLKKAKIPVVVIDGTIEGFGSIIYDDATDLEQLTGHLLDVHGFTRIDVLTGHADNAVSLRRLEGCRQAFAKHGLTLTDEHVFYGDFWYDSGREQARRYISGELPLPQAVICTNDYMAYALCDALSAAGVDIPGQVTVTGYDYSNTRVYHYPVLTTYRKDRRRMGMEAVQRVLGRVLTIPASDGFVSGNTCTCGVKQDQLMAELTAEQVDRDQRLYSITTPFSSRLTMCRTIAEYTEALKNNFSMLHGADSLYFNLDTTWNTPESEGKTYLSCRIDPVNSCAAPQTIERGALFPAFREERDTPAICYFSPICFQTRLFGFAVLTYHWPAVYYFSFRDWINTVGDTLEFLRMKNDLHYLTQCQRASTLYDALTGFHTLREFKRLLQEDASRQLLLCIKLRFAEDAAFLHGENIRNDVIAAAARAIRKACSRAEICCRAGEDTFFILCNEKDALIQQKIKVLLNHALSAKYDERICMLSMTAVTGEVNDELLAQAELAAEEQLAQAQCDMAERRLLPQYDTLVGIRQNIYTAPKTAPSLEDASRSLCVSEGYFRTIYKRCFGVSYHQECIQGRLLHACYLLTSTAMSIYAIASSCGYTDEKFFARQFKQYVGFSPMEYRSKTCRTV